MDMKVLHLADSRGLTDLGWLHSRHTFSFGGYRDFERVHFGALRVLNDDIVAAGKGFGQHPHDNMEIVSIPLQGELEHQDSMGNKAIIRAGDIQVMSAGTGVLHSEYNRREDQDVHFLQIWIIPKVEDVSPRYDQIHIGKASRHNKFLQILSPNPADEGVWIHQDAWFHIGQFDKDFMSTYELKRPENGVYSFVLSGHFHINGQALGPRDGLGLAGPDKLQIQADSADAEILLMEVPMQLP